MESLTVKKHDINNINTHTYSQTHTPLLSVCCSLTALLLTTVTAATSNSPTYPISGSRPGNPQLTKFLHLTLPATCWRVFRLNSPFSVIVGATVLSQIQEPLWDKKPVINQPSQQFKHSVCTGGTNRLISAGPKSALWNQKALYSHLHLFFYNQHQF